MRRILVTGANKGIGLAIARGILAEHQDTFVYLGTRDLARGNAAAATLPAGRFEVVELDVSRDDSVSAARAKITEPLYGLVNNAGIGTGASLAAMLETNTRGIHRVCEAFLPLIDPKQGRIVNVTSASGPSYVSSASEAHKKVLLDPTMTWPRLASFLDHCVATGEGEGSAYGLSKAAANVYTLLLAREHPNLRINACTPGFIETDMTRPYVESQGKSATELGMKTPADGAKTPLFLLFGEPEGNGRYYGSDAKRSPLDRYRAPGSAAYEGA